MIRMTLPARLICGVSGGADSVALLRMLLDAGRAVTAIHVNHGLRGAESDADEQFVRGLCARWQVPLLVYRADPPENPGEDWARQARYGFFRQAMADTGAEALALAHHRDDQAETLLLHLLRGTGLTGLTGMKADVTVDGLRIVRPLLHCSRAELRAWLTAIGQPWREDGSNADARYLRNALRLEALPMLEQLAPGAARRMAQTAHTLAEDEAVLNALSDAFLRDCPNEPCLPLAALRSQLPGLQKRILRAWWQRHAKPEGEISLSAAQTEALVALLAGGGKCNLPQGWHALSGWTHLHLVPPGVGPVMPEMPLRDCPLAALEPFAGHPGDGRSTQAIPAGWADSLTVRTRRPGDWLRPFGSGGRQSLQDYFTNRRVDAPFRDRVPLVCRGSEVLLIGGVGAGDIPRLDTINHPVLLRWTTAFPWQQA